MKKFFSFLMAIMVALSVSANVPASAKMVHGKQQPVLTAKRHLPVQHKSVRQIEMQKPMPRMMATATSAFDGVLVEFYMSYSTEDAIDHYITFYNVATDYPMAVLDIYTSEVGAIEGTYSVAAGNLDLEYAGFYTSDEDEGTEITAASLTIAKSGESYTFEGSLTAGGAEYPISITAAVEVTDGDYPYEPEQQSDIVLNFDTMEIDTEWLTVYGELDYYFYTAEENVLSLAYFPTNTDIKSIPDGTYTFSDEDYDAFGTGYYYYGYPGGSYYATDEAYFYIVSGSVVVATEGDETTITMNALSAYGTKISFTYSYTKGTTPPTPSGDVTITGLKYAEAYYVEGFWDFDLYTSEDGYYPDVYFSCYEEAPSATSIVGTYTAYYAGYWKSATDSVEADYYEPVGSLTVACVSQGVYNFVGSFEGQDGKTYVWNAQNIAVSAYDTDNDYEYITLTDAGSVVPPTPVGDEITVAQAEAIAQGLKDNEITSQVYTIKGYVGTLYDSGDFFLVSAPGERSNLQVYKPTVNGTIAKGTQVIVVGKLQKYISKAGNTILEVVSATVTPVGGGTVTPSGSITVAQAEAIAAQLNNNQQTSTEYVVLGYAATAYDPESGTQSVWMTDVVGSKGNFFAKQATVTNGTIRKNDYFFVQGKIEKSFYNNKTTYQIYRGKATIVNATALDELVKDVDVQKLLRDNVILIYKDGQLYNLNGRLVQ